MLGQNIQLIDSFLKKEALTQGQLEALESFVFTDDGRSELNSRLKSVIDGTDYSGDVVRTSDQLVRLLELGAKPRHADIEGRTADGGPVFGLTALERLSARGDADSVEVLLKACNYEKVVKQRVLNSVGDNDEVSRVLKENLTGPSELTVNERSAQKLKVFGVHGEHYHSALEKASDKGDASCVELLLRVCDYSEAIKVSAINVTTDNNVFDLLQSSLPLAYGEIHTVEEGDDGATGAVHGLEGLRLFGAAEDHDAV